MMAGHLAQARPRLVGRKERFDPELLERHVLRRALWVVTSAVVLAFFWGQLAPLARGLVIAVALVVEVFAALPYRAAGHARRGALEAA